MRIAVLTLTRDRQAYTRHCFARLHERAGATFDHHVLDQGSRDGTAAWLKTYADDRENVTLQLLDSNVGISRGMNRLLDSIDLDEYDAVVKFDNDCELVDDRTLARIGELTVAGGCLLSPRILGLKNPPRAKGELRIGEEIILDVAQIGGIFLAAPAWIYDEFRFNEDNPYWGMDDVEICAWFRARGGTCGYVKALEAWHCETTDGQERRLPDYFERKYEEMAACR